MGRGNGWQSRTLVRVVVRWSIVVVGEGGGLVNEFWVRRKMLKHFWLEVLLFYRKSKNNIQLTINFSRSKLTPFSLFFNSFIF